MKALQVMFMPMNNESITEEDINGVIGMFILMNIIYVITLIWCTIIYLKKQNRHGRYYYNYFNYVFLDGANTSVGYVIVWICGIIDVCTIFIYLGFLIGKLL